LPGAVISATPEVLITGNPALRQTLSAILLLVLAVAQTADAAWQDNVAYGPQDVGIASADDHGDGLVTDCGSCICHVIHHFLPSTGAGESLDAPTGGTRTFHLGDVATSVTRSPPVPPPLENTL